MAQKTMTALAFCLCVMMAAHVPVAHALPLTGISVRVVPVGGAQSAPKIVDVVPFKERLRLNWFELAREAVPDQPFPVYKVRTKHGVMDMDGLQGKRRFYHPHLWGHGYVNLGESLPLWIAPELIALDGKAREDFHLGLIEIDPVALKAAPNRYYEGLLYLQNLYDFYIRDGEVNRKAQLTRAQQKELKVFLRDFFRVGLIAKTSAKLAVNKEIKNHPARIIGNAYFSFVALDDPKNPLVINLRIFPDKAPEVLRDGFKFLKDNFEFQITQVNF